MGILTAVLPWWARWLAISALLAAFGWWCWLHGVQHNQTINDARIAAIERAHAEALMRIAQAGAAAAQRTATITAAQAAATQETDHAALDQRAALDARIAAGGLRIHTTIPAAAGCRAVPPIPDTTGQPHADAAKPLPTAAPGSAGAVPPAVDDPVLTGAARDAQHQLQLMDWIEAQRAASMAPLH